MNPPNVDVSMSAKIALLWQTNKPLVIAIIAAIVLIIIGIILLIVFLVIKPGSNSETTLTPANTTNGTKAAVATAKHLYVHLRNMAN